MTKKNDGTKKLKDGVGAGTVDPADVLASVKTQAADAPIPKVDPEQGVDLLDMMRGDADTRIEELEPTIYMGATKEGGQSYDGRVKGLAGIIVTNQGTGSLRTEDPGELSSINPMYLMVLDSFLMTLRNEVIIPRVEQSKDVEDLRACMFVDIFLSETGNESYRAHLEDMVSNRDIPIGDIKHYVLRTAKEREIKEDEQDEILYVTLVGKTYGKMNDDISALYHRMVGGEDVFPDIQRLEHVLDGCETLLKYRLPAEKYKELHKTMAQYKIALHQIELGKRPDLPEMVNPYKKDKASAKAGASDKKR
ncbi:hypothetical protein HN587_02035 [Candidatus Woesearchaeota archaeon]|jgi:hypothetical protein|nr:hypothetical protein [Candidatus Woesearchaeota archaeon]